MSEPAGMDAFTHLSEPVREALSERGFTTPTEPQRKAIPPIAAGRNVLVLAPTGTGKTETSASRLTMAQVTAATAIEATKIPTETSGCAPTARGVGPAAAANSAASKRIVPLPASGAAAPSLPHVSLGRSATLAHMNAARIPTVAYTAGELSSGATYSGGVPA